MIHFSLALFLTWGATAQAAEGEQTWDLEAGALPPEATFRFWDPAKKAFSIEISDKEKTPEGNHAFEITAVRESDSKDEWKCQLMMISTLSIVKGHTYRVRFWARATERGVTEAMANLGAAPYTELGSTARQAFRLESSWTLCTFEFTADRDWDGRLTVPRIMFKGYPVGAKIFIGSVSVRDSSRASTLDFRSVANFGFADAKSADGVGGWSDQGPDNDFAEFPVRQKLFCGIPFQIVDPAQNQGKAIVVFDSPSLKTGVRQISLPVSEAARGRKYLYLLQTLCGYAKSGEEPVGKILFTLEDGTVQEQPVVPSRDLADWWQPKKLPNGLVGYVGRNRSSEVGVYLSRYEMPGKPVTKITLESAAVKQWIVVGATLCDFSAEEVQVPEERIVAGEQWKATDMADLLVKSGSALDFSALVTREPAGTQGRLTVSAQGRPVFEKTKDKPVRFFTCPVLPDQVLNEKTANTHEDIDRYAEAIARQGYNMVRLHFVDAYLMGTIHARKLEPTYFDDPATIPFDAANFDRILYFVSCLKKRGVYILLDLGTNTSGYTDVSPWRNNLKPGEYPLRLFVDSKVRANWRAGNLKLLTTVNSYTGLALAKDPILTAVVFYNEQNTRFTYGSKGNDLGETFYPAWKKWVQAKYKTLDALQKAWAGAEKLPSPLTFDNVPVIDEARYNTGGPLGQDMAKFLVELSRDLTQWYESVVREAGYTGLTVQWDFILRQSELPLRAMMPIVVMHGYQAHPSDWVRPGSTIDQSSSLTYGGGYFRWLVPTRLLDRPFLISEYGHTFWNRYRHEQGLFFPSYASLQDWDCIALSHIPTHLWPKAMESFNNTGNDPINRASEVIAALAFLRGDVSPSNHTVEFPLTEKDIFDNGNAYARAFNYDLSMLYTLCKVGVSYTGNLTPIAPGAKVTPTLKIKASDGSTFKDHGAFGTVESDAKSETALARAVRQVRESGIIDKSNVTDVSKRLYQSDTKELTLGMDGDGMLTVITPRLEGVAVKQDKPHVLKNLTVNACSVPAVVAAASLDKTKTLDAAERIIVVFSTDALNSGMRFSSPARTTILDNGKLPVLTQVGKVSVTIANRALTKPVAYALKFNGERGDKLPVTVENGRITVTMDTAKLAIGPSPFIEITK
ncbi:MAG: hypothetical protein B9S32_04585 [Verrucomicrobia bacterium Tous-C9LFEB]|nr:MAG: hypothetical protein B9S32_04585 [Verrucomicrobia bacterium Tous-C9LFEB]